MIFCFGNIPAERHKNSHIIVPTLDNIPLIMDGSFIVSMQSSRGFEKTKFHFFSGHLLSINRWVALNCPELQFDIFKIVPKKSSTNFCTVPFVDNNRVRKISGIDLCDRPKLAAAKEED